MNRLQGLGTAEQYCVSLNSEGLIAQGKTLARMEYRHPVYNQASVRAQSDWEQISGKDRLHYCGAWWFNGFHEDGVRSGLRVAESLGVKW